MTIFAAHIFLSVNTHLQPHPIFVQPHTKLIIIIENMYIADRCNVDVFSR